MNYIKNYTLKFGSFAAALSLAACAQGDGGVAGEAAPFLARVHVTEKQNTAVNGDITEAAINYVAEQYNVIGGLSAGDDFLVKVKTVGNDGLNHVRMDQAYDGVRVFGADIVVHASSETFRSISGTLVKELDGFSTTPDFPEADAVALSKSDYAQQAKDSGAALEYDRENTELVIYPTEERKMQLAWHVQFYTELQAGISPGLWNYFIDAKTGEMITKFNGIHTAIQQASGPGGNPKVPRTWNAELDVDDSTGQFRMDTSSLPADQNRLITIDLQNATSGGVVVERDRLDGFDDAAANDAHGYGEATLNYMREWYGYDSLDDNGFVIRSRVHYSSNYENAFWDGTQMTYGDGASFFYPLSGDEDVVAHEFNHGFTTFHSNLTYSAQSGGINESFSDVAGVLVSFFLNGDNGDFDIGAKIFQQDGALRFMCDPPQDGRSIGHADDYTNGMDVHFSSGVFNKAFCRAVKRFASGDPEGSASQAAARRVGQAWYEANANYWNASTNFDQGCQGVMDAANALGFSAQEVEMLNASFQDVGVFCDGATTPINCDEILTEENGSFTSPNYPNNYPDNFKKTTCIQPASGQPATLTFDDFNTEANFDFVEIKDANSNVISNTSGTTRPEPVTSTLIAVTFTSDGSVTQTGFSASWSTGSVPNERPVVEISQPTEASEVSGTITVAASAQDPDGSVARVVFALPDGSQVEDASAPFEIIWESTTVADGEYQIRAIAVDDLGAESDVSEVNIIVANGGDCTDGSFENSVPVSIPDNNATGIVSSLSINGAGTVADLLVDVNITHTWRGDLVVTLVAPSGRSVVLHNRSGSSQDNVIISGLDVSELNGESIAGTWQLQVQDLAGADLGTLNSWSLAISGDCGGGGGNGDWEGSAAPDLATVDNGTACTSLTVAQSGDASLVKLDLAGEHAWRAILSATLEHNGITVEAFPQNTFDIRDGAFTLIDHAVSGMTGDASGEWTLCITDNDEFGDTGVLNTWSVHN